MKIFLGYMIGCMLIGALLWRRQDKLKLLAMFGMAVMVCLVYFFTNAI